MTRFPHGSAREPRREAGFSAFANNGYRLPLR